MAQPAQLCIATESLLGEGTSGKAFLVDNEHDGHRYCLKVVPLARDDAEVRIAAANEARLHASLTHEGIVRYCYSWKGGGGDTVFVLMELCDTDLWSCLESAAGAAALTSGVRTRWSLQLAGALAHVHGQCIAHRDLNPWNVFLTADRDAKVGDFGLSVRVPDGCELSGWETAGAAPLDASAIGSLYSAPELGGERYGLAADVFSLGMTLYVIWGSASAASLDDLVSEIEALREGGEPPAAFGDACPFAPAILRMVANDPGTRPSAAEALAAIEASATVRV
jgi:serine/threonine protein kinase